MRTIPLLVALSACVQGPHDIDLDHELNQRGLCDDAEFYATESGGSVLLDYRSPGLLGQAFAVDEPPYVQTVTFPDPIAGVVLWFGVRVAAVTCENDTPEDTYVEWEFVPSSGTATVTIDPTGQTFPVAPGTLELTDVVFSSTGREIEPLTLPSMTITGVFGDTAAAGG